MISNVRIVWRDEWVIRRDNETDGLREIVIKVEVKEIRGNWYQRW